MDMREAVGRLGDYRVVHLSKVVDPAVEGRRCELTRHAVEVQGVSDYHTDVDIVTHLGTHVESPYHHGDLTNDVTSYPVTHFMGRGVLMRLDTCEARALITREDLDAADGGRVRAGDVLILDSRFHSEPFVESDDDDRPHLSRESAEWFVEKGVKAVGFGDGICIESNVEQCVACHDVMLANDVLFIEVLQNIDRLERGEFLVVYLPLPIVGLDSSPVNMVAIEGVAGI